MIRSIRNFCFVFMICLITYPALAQIPATINYQGRLETLDGVPYEGTIEIAAGLFESASGGTALWGETHAGVEVVNGVYSLMLGTGQPLSGLAYGLLSEVPFDRLYSLELTIDGETLDARQALSSVPYALNAPALEGITVKDGKLGIGDREPHRSAGSRRHDRCGLAGYSERAYSRRRGIWTWLTSVHPDRQDGHHGRRQYAGLDTLPSLGRRGLYVLE